MQTRSNSRQKINLRIPSRLVAGLSVLLIASPLLLLLSSTPVNAQLAPESQPVVEMVLADTEHQARVAARAMWTGFLVEQLLIPETSYIGRFAWSDLQPSLRLAMQDARPGEPNLLVGGEGKFLVARILPQGPPALLGESEYAYEAEEIWAVLSTGPTDPKLLSREIDIETEDLAAICRSKTQLIQDELEEARAKIARLSPSAAPAAAIEAYAPAISALSFQGKIGEAINRVRDLVKRLPEQTSDQQPSSQRTYRDVMHQVLGIFELRRGEVENCLQHHHREMCLFPLSENARHRLDSGARAAINHFTQYLDKHPTDLEVRWLLNIAAMTAGTYPDGVEEHLRIGPESFNSQQDPGRFWDVAVAAGVAGSDNAGGSITDDFDGDGLLDIVVSSRDPCSPLLLHRNRGDGTFEDISVAAGLSQQLGGLNIIQVDFDNDGRLDLFVMRGGWETAIRNSLLRNRAGEGGMPVFEDVTTVAGLGGLAHRTHSAAWADYDGDGWLDVFLGHEHSFSQLFRNRGNGTFEDTTEAAGMRFRSFTKGATWGDVDNDGRPDLYVSNFGDRNLLFHNLGGTFREVGRERGVAGPTYSFPTWFWDFDNDGHQDLFVATHLQTVDEVAREYLGLEPKGETLRLFRNKGGGFFEDVTLNTGLSRVVPSMGANFGDLDNDGFLDLYLGTGAPPYGMLIPNRLFLNQGGHQFVDVTTTTGTGHLQKGHGVSFADLDNDGDQDIFTNIGGAFPGDKYPNALFENPGHGNNWLSLRLIGTHSNRAAMGARIRVLLKGDGELRQRVRWVTSGGSFGSSPLTQHIGLGKAAKIERVEIDWPARIVTTNPGDQGAKAQPPRRQVLEDVPVNQALVVIEGEPGFRQATPIRFTLGGTESHGH